MNWELSRFKGGKKWVSWSAGAWVTWRKSEPDICHVGFRNKYQGIWDMNPEATMQKLEQIHAESLAAN